MLAFSYDKSFEGLLAVIFDAYTGKRFPDILLGDGDIPPLTATEIHRVLSREDKSSRVLEGLKKRLTLEGMNNLACAWLADQHGTDMLLARYMRGVFDEGRSYELEYSRPDVFAVNRLARNVHGETHLLKGFARFQKTADNQYFSAIAPRYNVLPLLCGHFAERFAEQPWVLYDMKRHYGLAHEQGAFHEIFLDESLLDQGGRLDDASLAEDERLFQTMWQDYCVAATIRERLNPRLHSRCLPRRFWPYMTEKQQVR